MKSIVRFITVLFCLNIIGCSPGAESVQTVDLVSVQDSQQAVAVPESNVNNGLEKSLPFEPEAVSSVYRFAKISNGAYFYTGNVDEVRYILGNLPDFRYEGVAFEQDTSSNAQPVYRFANLNNGGYFFTGSPIERD